MRIAPRPDGRPLVMGVVNVTPDSFSDGGRHADADAAAAHALSLAAQGADVIDIGGESTRPGAAPVDEAEELARVIPVIERVRAQSAIPVSIDTMKPAVARAAAAAGADMWNDVSALRAPGAPETAADLGLPVILMHMRGEPGTMQDAPRYDDAAAEVTAFLLQRAEAATQAGVTRENIWLDPGIGFGKTLAHNLELLRSIPALAAHGFPLCIGVSRKRFIAAIDAGAGEGERLGGSLYAALHAAQHGVAMLRVHDVRETVQALKVRAAILGGP